MQGAAVLGSIDQQGLEPSALRIAEATGQVAMRLPPRPGPTRERQAFHQGRRGHGDAAFLQVLDHRASDRLAPVRARGAGRGRPDRGAIVRLAHAPQIEERRDLPRVLAACAVPPGVQREDGGLDAELVGDGLDYRGGWRLIQAQGAAEVAHQGELHGEAEPVVRAPVPSRERKVLQRQGAAAQSLVAVDRRVKEQGTHGWREELGGWRGHGRSGTGGSVSQTYPGYLDGLSILDVVCGRIFASARAAGEAVQQSSG